MLLFWQRQDCSVSLYRGEKRIAYPKKRKHEWDCKSGFTNAASSAALYLHFFSSGGLWDIFMSDKVDLVASFLHMYSVLVKVLNYLWAHPISKASLLLQYRLCIDRLSIWSRCVQIPDNVQSFPKSCKKEYYFIVFIQLSCWALFHFKENPRLNLLM